MAEEMNSLTFPLCLSFPQNDSKFKTVLVQRNRKKKHVSRNISGKKRAYKKPAAWVSVWSSRSCPLDNSWLSACMLVRLLKLTGIQKMIHLPCFTFTFFSNCLKSSKECLFLSFFLFLENGSFLLVYKIASESSN